MGYAIAWESTFGSEEPAGWDGAMGSCPARPLNGVAHIVVALREPGGTCSSPVKRISSELGSDLGGLGASLPEMSPALARSLAAMLPVEVTIVPVQVQMDETLPDLTSAASAV